MRKGPNGPRGGRGKSGDGDRREKQNTPRGGSRPEAGRGRKRDRPPQREGSSHDTGGDHNARSGKSSGATQRAGRTGASAQKAQRSAPTGDKRSGPRASGSSRPAGKRQRGIRSGGAPAEQRGEELRIQVFLARAGVASRRASEDLVRAGRVRINDEPAELGQKVVVGQDRVTLDDAPVRVQAFEWVLLHKPRGYVTTREDPEGRRTIYDLLPDDLRHLFHVGRLDRDSTGIILLTNEGETANRLLHPRYGTTKEYVADVMGRPDDDALEALVRGVELDDGPAQAVEVEYLGDAGDDGARIRIVLEEGRNREVKRMLEAIGHPVRSLYRRRFGPLTVGRLRRGEWRRLTDAEVERLREYTH